MQKCCICGCEFGGLAMSEYVNEKKELEQALREEFQNFKLNFGYNPTTIWDMPTKNKLLQLSINHDEIAKGSYRTTKEGGCQGTRQGFSQFQPELAERIIKFYTNEDDKILDIFSGRTRAIITRMFNRKYIGYEISREAYKQTVNALKRQQTLFVLKEPIIHNKDAISVSSDYPSNYFDVIFTCPPYWNIEKYETCNGQLSDISDYKDFLNRYEQIIVESKKVLKDGGLVIWIVGNFRKNGKFYDFCNDTKNIFYRNGFELHDEIIRKIYTNITPRIKQSVERKRMVKTHEYVLIFKK